MASAWRGPRSGSGCWAVISRFRQGRVLASKRAYDAYDRKGDGCIRATVHRDPDDPNVVVVTETFPDLATARAHANSQELKAAMGEAGVAGPPEVWFSEDVENVGY